MSGDIQALFAAAEGGDAAAAFALGSRFTEGSAGVEKDVCEAARYFKKAADQGHAGGQCNYGVCLKSGEGVEKDVCEAARYLKMAADQGDAEGQFKYGLCLANGQGVEQNVCEAVRYYKMAADQGEARAITKLSGLR